MAKAERKSRRLMRSALACGLALLCLPVVGCVSIEHLGDRTGVAFNKVFTEQAGGRRRLKRMEAELAEVVAKRFVESEPQTKQGPRLTLVGAR